jgi:signal transduction histidine kinase
MTQLQETAARLVKVQDTTRRRLERNLHDGAQQRLTAMVMKLGLARSQTDPQAVSALLDELAADTGAALDELRELARGMFPPLLAAQGLRAAWPHCVARRRLQPFCHAHRIAIRQTSKSRSTSAAPRRCKTWPATPLRVTARSTSGWTAAPCG